MNRACLLTQFPSSVSRFRVFTLSQPQMGTSILFTHSSLSFSHPKITKPRPSSPLSSLAIPARKISLKSNRTHHKSLSLTPVRALHNPSTSETKTLPFFSFPPIDLSQVTPLTICKWAAFVSFAIAATKKTAFILSSPFFWMYFSWTWLFWPWIIAISLAIYGLYCVSKYSSGQASIFEQLAIVTAATTWFTLVPPAYFNGFLEGWPFVFFFIYHYFFFFESTVRRRLYGDLYPREHDPKWDIKLPLATSVAFSVFMLIAHWLAAWEGPELHLVPGGWANVGGIWVLIMTTLFMRYHSILYLANYSEKVAVPQEVVQFGPYRWVRHPIYASTMLLFATYCIALRAPLSLLFVISVCLMYYGRKAELEESLMLETFGERYKDYMKKVRYKLIPLLY